MKDTEVDFLHSKIMTAERKFWLDSDGSKEEFDSLQNLLYHYQENPLNPEVFSIGKEYTSETFNQQQKSKQS